MTLTKLLFPVLIATTIASCAPALQNQMMEDPVFAPGQVWEMGTPAGTVLTLTVPARDKAAKYPAYSSSSTVVGKPYLIRFWYDPVDSDPEFINVSQLSLISRTGDICYVQQPGKVQVGQILSGAYFGSMSDAFANSQAYVNTGIKDKLQSCTLKRIS
ncbi:hypothetical protein MF271_08485 [Deinococcus sp. KNUC1210]|uniref:hypothetical protein n=1 Tax=Deinococcus sp. KNUC1210 TaxID=2917691 RepID=UPI001EEFAC1D|nr:hypothetical protein [Deinococcus sp. KNUC1210]ULH16595.1 hypothetical protein MF271_08485 [Deinococcus sp. KNUC1210]